MQNSKNGFNVSITSRTLGFFAAVALVSACSTTVSSTGYAAHGFLTPVPHGEGELIGVFETEHECRAAGEAWMSRQVVGNPVSAECYPVDRG